jgi:hypothetical protein
MASSEELDDLKQEWEARLRILRRAEACNVALPGSVSEDEIDAKKIDVAEAKREYDRALSDNAPTIPNAEMGH